MVFEDDVLVPPNLGARLATLLPKMPGEWDILLLNMMINVRRGTQVRTLMRLWRSLAAAPGERYELLDASTYFCWLTAAYVVHPRSRLRNGSGVFALAVDGSGAERRYSDGNLILAGLAAAAGFRSVPHARRKPAVMLMSAQKR